MTIAWARWWRPLVLGLLGGGSIGCAQPHVFLLTPDVSNPRPQEPETHPAAPPAVPASIEARAIRDPAVSPVSAAGSGSERKSEQRTSATGNNSLAATPRDEGETISAPVPPDTAPADDETPALSGFPEEVRLGQVFDPFRPVRVRAGGEGGEENEDTDLTRPRAERAGEGGGPTKAAEEDDDEDYPKSNLLVKVLGMEDSDTQLFGWVDGSFTANPSRPANGENFGVFPNNHANSWMFNQIYFVVEKKLDEEEDDEFGYGFRVDNLLGADWQVSHALGLFDHAFVLNRFGYDIPQFYGEIHLPVLTPGGVDIKAGRWYALPGYEDLAAPGRPLLSTTYMFSYAQPITQLGVMSTWHVNDQLNVYNGVTNGWDRWFNIHNGIGFAHAVAWDSKDGRTNLTMTFNVGPNQLQRFLPANFNVAPVAVTPPPFLAGRRNLSAPNSSAYLFTAVGTHEFTDDLTGIIEANLGWENNVAGAGFGGTSVNAAWYGLAGWTLYDFLDQLIGVARLEVFRDNNGFLTGFSDNFYEATLGMIYRPRSWLWARPEIRYDWAQFTRPYNDGNSKSQLTFGFDVIFLF